MLADVDLAVRALLRARMSTLRNTAGVVAEGQIGIQPPDNLWISDVNGFNPPKGLNVYLADVRENRKLRTNERIDRAPVNGAVYREPAPSRFDCHYLISAWSGSTDRKAKTIDEHKILAEALTVLVEERAIAVGGLDLPTSIAPPEGFPKLAEFWGTMGEKHRWKPAIAARRDRSGGRVVRARRSGGDDALRGVPPGFRRRSRRAARPDRGRRPRSQLHAPDRRGASVDPARGSGGSPARDGRAPMRRGGSPSWTSGRVRTGSACARWDATSHRSPRSPCPRPPASTTSTSRRPGKECHDRRIRVPRRLHRGVHARPADRRRRHEHGGARRNRRERPALRAETSPQLGCVQAGVRRRPRRNSPTTTWRPPRTGSS